MEKRDQLQTQCTQHIHSLESASEKFDATLTSVEQLEQKAAPFDDVTWLSAQNPGQSPDDANAEEQKLVSEIVDTVFMKRHCGMHAFANVL